MRIHYLEIVTTEVDAVCSAYAAASNLTFGDPEPGLGNARTATTQEGAMVGVRAPMHEAEEPVVRPYWLVEDIEAAVAGMELGAFDYLMKPCEMDNIMAKVTEAADWQPRDSSGEVVYKNRLWILGGWFDSSSIPVRYTGRYPTHRRTRRNAPHRRTRSRR